MRRVLTAATVGAVLLLLPTATVAFAQELTGGCVLEVRSFFEPQLSGGALDEGAVEGPIAQGDVGSSSRPFLVEPNGSVDFLFSTSPTVFANNEWAIYAQGIPVPLLSGSDDNPLDVDETGVVEIHEMVKALPFRVVGTFYVSGDLWGNGNANHCHGSGYVELLGAPSDTPIWMIGIALAALGLVGLLVATPYSRTWETDPNAGEQLRSGRVTDEPPRA
jgi:hypothetical protein